MKGIASEKRRQTHLVHPHALHELNPINHGLGIKQCTACALNMAWSLTNVSSLPELLPALGNILTDDWKGIWEHDLCKRIRNREYLDGDCVDCAMREVCGGGCPLSREHGDYICLDRHSNM